MDYTVIKLVGKKGKVVPELNFKQQGINTWKNSSRKTYSKIIQTTFWIIRLKNYSDFTIHLNYY